jgi:hypothetical protein
MEPTVGRIVHYFPLHHEQDELHEIVGNPLAAIIVTVWSGECVNLTVFDGNGNTHSRTSVAFMDQAGIAERDPDAGGFATWPERAAG